MNHFRTDRADEPVQVLIAVKALRLAKSRLAPVYDPQFRSRLVTAMLADTVQAALASDLVRAVSVVTPDPHVAEAARAAGADVIADPAMPYPTVDKLSSPAAYPDPLNSALDFAARHFSGRAGHTPIVALQADLPALRPAELTGAIRAAAIEAALGRPRSVVADRHETGTAALILSDPAVELDPRFGRDSAAAHIRSGAVALPGHWPGLRCDVDTPEDIAYAVEIGLGTRTRKVLGDYRRRGSKSSPVRPGLSSDPASR